MVWCMQGEAGRGIARPSAQLQQRRAGGLLCSTIGVVQVQDKPRAHLLSVRLA
jgi:hypothetical protein